MSTATTQPEPLRLAQLLESFQEAAASAEQRAAAELRRLHAENQQLRADLEAVGAGGVGPLIPATVQHQREPSSDNELQRKTGDLITTAAPPQSGGNPPNWQLVPVEPTPEMLDAGRNACEGRFYPQDMLHGPRAMMTDKWAAMLAAAPSAPAENSLTCRKQLDLQKCATPATVELTDDRIERTWQFLHDEEGNPPDQCEFARAIITEYGSATAPQPPAVDHPEPAYLLRDLADDISVDALELIAAIRDAGLGDYSINMRLPARVCVAMCKRFADVGRRPVARVAGTGHLGGHFDWCVPGNQGVPRGTLLYTRPKPRKPLTVEQVQEISENITWYEGDCGRIDPMQFARAIERAHKIGGEE